MESTSKDWRDEAACRSADPELFFPAGESSASDREQIRDAKLYCGKCAVQAACLEYALATGQTSGVWGDTSAGERRSIKIRNYGRQRLTEISGTYS